MPVWSAIANYAEVPGRDENTADGGSILLQSCDFAHSWGVQPASATASYVRHHTNAEDLRVVQAGVSTGAYLELVLGPYTFYGLCHSDTSVQGSRGRVRELQFRDLREFLDWDVVFGVFNKADDRRVLVGGRLRRRRRWKHLLPANWATRHWTTSDLPLTATQILNYILAAPTIGSPWTWVGHPAMDVTPALELDFEGGVKLGPALLAVADRLGLQFTLSGKYQLKFRRKGELLVGETFPVSGGNFVFPDGAEDCRQGNSLSGQPTRLFVVGDRNLYQVNNLVLVPDWAGGWTQFWDESLFFRDIFLNHTAAEGDDAQQLKRWANARDKALKLTVRDYYVLKGADSAYFDGRLFAGQSRMDMPAVAYIRELVLRAWRLPATILGRPAEDMEPVNQMLGSVEHNTSGVMSLVYDEPGVVASEGGESYAIAEGVGINAEAFQAINPRNFNLADWVTKNNRWGVVNGRLDPNGGDGIGFVVFERPMFKADDVLVVPAATPQAAVLNADFTPTLPAVRAAITFRGEVFQHTAESGFSGSRDDVLNESNLRRERIYNEGGGAPLHEVPYADDETAADKAAAVAASRLARQWSVVGGGYERLIPDGSSGLVLNGMYDRLRVQVTPGSSGGLREFVDFTSERSWSTYVPERFFDRRSADDRIFPGQDALRQEQIQAAAFAQVLATDPASRTAITRMWQGQPGVAGEPVHVQIAGATSTPKLAAGTPLWSLPAPAAPALPAVPPQAPQPVMPSATTLAHTNFRGVVCRHNEDPRGDLPVLPHGPFLARVHGGAGGLAEGSDVGLSPGNDYLAAATDANTTVGRIDRAVAASTVELVMVNPGGGGGGALVWD